jgi:hypothetical protein
MYACGCPEDHHHFTVEIHAGGRRKDNAFER